MFQVWSWQVKFLEPYRIGIDFETLKDLGLDIEDVEEEYKPGNHLKPLQEGGELADMYPKDWVDYVEHARVEINSVVTELDDNDKFWNGLFKNYETDLIHEITTVL